MNHTSFQSFQHSYSMPPFQAERHLSNYYNFPEFENMAEEQVPTNHEEESHDLEYYSIASFSPESVTINTTNNEKSNSEILQKPSIDNSKLEILEQTLKPMALHKKKRGKYILQKPKIQKEPVWSSEEDELLCKLAVTYKNDWKKVVKRFLVLRGIKKSPTFLRERYKELSNSNKQKRSKFTHQEDLKLIEGICIHGMNWIEIAKTIPNRDPIMLKNRYYSYIRRRNLLKGLIQELKTLNPNCCTQNVIDLQDNSEEISERNNLTGNFEIDFIKYPNDGYLEHEFSGCFREYHHPANNFSTGNQ